MEATTKVKAAMLGMGSVNQNLLRIIANKEKRLAEDRGVIFEIVAATDSSGILVAGSGGLGKLKLVAHKEAGKSLSELSQIIEGQGCSFQDATSTEQVLQGLEVDLLFEATPCCVGDQTKLAKNGSSAGDEEHDSEALRIVRSALSRGVSVVLANKGPLVHAMNELVDLSSQPDNKGRLQYSATVCGGLPILNIGKRDMIAGTITKLQGVFNATSNFVLEALAQGGSFQDAIAEAQKVGAAEADPSLDTDGWDTAFKLLIIVNTIILGQNVEGGRKPMIKLEDVKVQGIQHISTEQIQSEAAKGNVIKLVATANALDGTYSVQPVAQPKDSFVGSITGWEMGVEMHSDIYGITYHKLYEKEPIPTAASMLRDAVNIFCDNDRR